MPKTGTIELTTFGGLTPDWVVKGSTDNLAYKRGRWDQSTFQTNINPFTIPGFLQPGYKYSALTGTAPTTAMTNMTVAIQGGTIAAYGIGANKLYKMTGAASDFNTIVDNSPTTPTWPHSISSSSTTKRHDLLVANINIGGTYTQCLLYSYNVSASGAGYLGRYDITNDSNWASGNSSDTAYALSTNDVGDGGASNALECDRLIVEGQDKKIYILGGYKVDSLDTTQSSATVQTNVWDVGRNYKLKSGVWYRDLLVMAAQKNVSGTQMKGQVIVQFWDGRSPFYETQIVIDDETAGALYVDGDDLYLFTASSTFGKLRKWNGRTFERIKDVPVSIPGHGGVDKWRDGIMFVASGLWIYGVIDLQRGRELYQISDTAYTCAKRLTPNNDIIHVATASSISKTDTTKYQDSAQFNFPIQDFPHRSTIKRMTFYCLPLATGADLLIKYLKNYSTTYTNYGTLSYGVSTQSGTDADGAVTKKVFNTNITDVSNLGLALTWAGSNAANQACITRIKLEYETNDNLASN